jgi:integrase
MRRHKRATRCNGDDIRLIQAWCEWKRAGGQAEGTIYLHAGYLIRLSEAHGLISVTPEELARWMARQPWARSTRRSVRSAVRGFFRWAQLHGHRVDDPSLLLPKVKAVEPLARPTPDHALRSALAAAAEDERLMLLLAASCGLRRAEIAALTTDDVDGRWLYVLGKGGKLRKLPIRSDELAKLLEQAPPGPLFPGRFGGSVTPDYVGRRLSRLLGPGWAAHSLRHRYATTIHTGCRDILALQRLLGHASSETTRLYVQTDDAALWAAAGHAS